MKFNIVVKPATGARHPVGICAAPAVRLAGSTTISRNVSNYSTTVSVQTKCARVDAFVRNHLNLGRRVSSCQTRSSLARSALQLHFIVENILVCPRPLRCCAARQRPTGEHNLMNTTRTQRAHNEPFCSMHRAQSVRRHSKQKKTNCKYLPDCARTQTSCERRTSERKLYTLLWHAISRAGHRVGIRDASFLFHRARSCRWLRCCVVSG